MKHLPIPAIRADLRPAGKDVVADPVFGRQVGLGGGGQVLVRLLASGGDVRSLSSRINISPPALLARLRHFARHGLFEGQRFDVSRAAMSAPETAPAEVLIPRDDLRHACQACGSCCSATDVGPVHPDIAAGILERDWTGDIPGLTDNSAVFREVDGPDGPTRLTAMRNDQCVFLADDKLCLIHRHLGFAAKPSPCRQFPYIFVDQGDGIAVSLQTECRAWWKARSVAGPTADEEDALNDLLARGAPVHRLPEAIVVDPGLAIRRADYLALEGRIIAAVRAAEATGDVFAVFAAYADAAEQELAALYAPIDADEGFCDEAAWRALFPGAFGAPVDPETNFSAAVSRFVEDFGGFASEAAVVADERGLDWLARRYEALNRASLAAVTLDTRAFLVRETDAVVGTVADLLVSALYAKQTVRRGQSLREGLALLGLQAWTTWAGACDRAKSACRVEVFGRDVIDSMVTIGKMHRERAVLDCCNDLKSLVVLLFLTNLGVFAQRRAPRLDAPGGIG